MRRRFIAGLSALLVLALPSTAQAAAAGTVTPDPLAFGSVQTGNTASHAVTITNTGDVDATVSESGANAGGFAAAGSCQGITLTVGAFCQDTISFSSATTGSFTDTFTVVLTGSDATTAQIDVPLSASAVTPPPPPVHIQSTALRPGVFYPLVRDGYRDWAHYSFTLNENASGTVQVYNRLGHLTRSYPFSDRNHMQVAWGGLNQRGERVKPGYYRFRVIAHRGGRKVASGLLRTRVRTAVLTRHKGLLFYGDQYTVRTTSGPCYDQRDYWTQSDLFLDCWGGNYALAKWRVSLPRGAFNVTATVTGRSYCCSSPGTITHLNAHAPRSITLIMIVTGWRSYDIRSVHFGYSYHVRI